MENVAYSLDLLKLVCNGKLGVAFGVQAANGREKLFAVFLG